jgi:DNA invertase Pin-like site-specific DNA recombinase
MDLGYARVSTTHQDLERQLVALAEHGITDERIYADKKTGATVDRPEFTKMLKYARKGDTIVATNLDRLGRNLRECLNLVHELRERGIGIKTLRDPLPIDTTDTSGMAEIAVAMLALFAHMERVFMRERAAHAREVAAAQGKQPGRPRKLTPAQLAMARAALREDQPVEQVAEAFGVSRATLYRYLAEAADAQQGAGEPQGKEGRP